ncbi:MAG: hypothetical protein WCS62_00290 [Bacilli bacterium]
MSDATGDTDINLFDIINAGEEYNGTESNNNISTFTRTMNLALHGTANGVATKDSNGHMNY